MVIIARLKSLNDSEILNQQPRPTGRYASPKVAVHRLDVGGLTRCLSKALRTGLRYSRNEGQSEACLPTRGCTQARDDD